MNTLLYIFLLFTLLVEEAFSQDTANVFYIAQLPAEGVLLNKAWRFYAGDNMEYAVLQNSLPHLHLCVFQVHTANFINSSVIYGKVLCMAKYLVNIFQVFCAEKAHRAS